MAHNRGPESSGTDRLTQRLRTTADTVAGTARLPSVDRVRARGDRRRHRRNAAVVLGALVLVGGVGTATLSSTPDRAPLPPAAMTPAPTPTPTAAVTPADLVDGSREVDLVDPGGAQLTATVDGALVVSPDAEAAAGGVSTAWVVRPVTGGTVQLVGVGARADDRDLCADVADAETVGFELCDPSRPSQVFTLATEAPAAGAVPTGGRVTTDATFRAASGYLVVADGRLHADADEATATRFTLQDRGPVQGTP